MIRCKCVYTVQGARRIIELNKGAVLQKVFPKVMLLIADLFVTPTIIQREKLGTALQLDLSRRTDLEAVKSALQF